MGAIGEFNTTLLNAANTVTGVLSDYAKNKSDFQLSRNTIDFNDELDAEIKRITRDTGWEKEQLYDEAGNTYALGKSEWEKQIDEWYNNKLSELNNSDSPYFAHNNYERRAMEEMIRQSRTSTASKIEQMAYQKTGEKMIVDAQNGIQKLTGMLQGQEFIDAANEYIKPLKDMGYLTPKQYDEWIKSNFQTGYMAYYNNKFSAAFDTAIAEDKNFTTLSNEIFKDDSLKLYGSDGLEIKMDKEMLQNSVKKVEEQNYNSKLIEVQTANYKGHEQRFNKIDDTLLDIIAGKSTDYQSVYNDCNVGLYVLKNQGGLQLAKGEQSTLSDKYVRYMDTLKDLQKAAKSGSGSTAVATYSTVIKNIPETFEQAVIDGQITDLYAATEAAQKEMRDAFYSQEYFTETKGMTEEQRNKWYNDNYSNYAGMKLLNSKALRDKAKVEYPELDAQYETLLDDFNKDVKNNPDPKKRKYSADTPSIMLEFLLDVTASTGRDTDKTEFIKKWNVMLNACTLDGLDGLFSQRKMFESENSYIARTANELEKNDIVFTNTKGEEKWASGETGKAKADNYAKDQKAWIEQQLGIDLSDPVYKKVRNDTEAVPLFKDKNGNTYHIETTGKKNNEPVIVDQNGKRYEGRDLKAEDKAAKKASNEQIKQQKQKLSELEDQYAEENDNKVMNTKSIPSKVVAAGSINKQDWEDSSNDLRLRYYHLDESIKAIDKMAGNKKVSEEEFKYKFGITKQEWKDMKGQSARRRFLIS